MIRASVLPAFLPSFLPSFWFQSSFQSSFLSSLLPLPCLPHINLAATPQWPEYRLAHAACPLSCPLSNGRNAVLLTLRAGGRRVCAALSGGRQDGFEFC